MFTFCDDEWTLRHKNGKVENFCSQLSQVAVSHTKLKKLNKTTRQWLLLPQPWTRLYCQGYLKYRGWSIDFYGPTMANLLHIVFTNTTWCMSMLISLWVTFQLQFNQRTKIQLENEGTFLLWGYCLFRQNSRVQGWCCCVVKRDGLSSRVS
jgi:hypothetical protein